MNENIKKLLEAVNNDVELKAKLKGAENIGEAVAVAQEVGFNITEEEAKDFMAKKSGELCDEELENVAGGGCWGSSSDELWWTGLN